MKVVLGMDIIMMVSFVFSFGGMNAYICSLFIWMLRKTRVSLPIILCIVNVYINIMDKMEILPFVVRSDRNAGIAFKDDGIKSYNTASRD